MRSRFVHRYPNPRAPAPTFARSTFHVCTFHVRTFARSTFPRSTFPRSHVPTFPVRTFARLHVPRARAVPAVNEWGTNKRMRSRFVHQRPHPRAPAPTFARLHVPRSTFHVRTFHVPTFARSTFHVRTFPVPVPSLLSTNGERINECGRASCTGIPTLAHLLPRLHVCTFHVPRSHVPRACAVPAVNEWGTNKRMRARFVHRYPHPRAPAPTFARSHVPRSTFPRLHVPTFPRLHVPTFHYRRASINVIIA